MQIWRQNNVDKQRDFYVNQFAGIMTGVGTGKYRGFSVHKLCFEYLLVYIMTNVYIILWWVIFFTRPIMNIALNEMDT